VWETFLAQTRLVDVCDALNCEDPTKIDKFAFTSGGGIDLEPLAWKFEVERFRDADGEPLSDHDALAGSGHGPYWVACITNMSGWPRERVGCYSWAPQGQVAPYIQ